MKLEHYQFPIGNKRPLQKDLEATKDTLRLTNRSLTVTRFENQQLDRHNHQLQEHNTDLQYRKLMPIIDTAADLSKTVVESFKIIDIHRQVFGVRVETPHLNTMEDSQGYYTKMVIRRCAEELALKITEYIAAELSKAHDRVELEKEGYKCRYL